MSAQLSPDAPDVVRRPLSVLDLSRMIDAGIIDEDEKIELLEGELIQVASKKYAHEVVKSALIDLFSARPKDVFMGVEASLRLTPDTLVEPDFLLCRRTDVLRSPEGFIGLAGRDLLLLIEVSDTTLRKDRGRKAAIYARNGVPEYWIVDTNDRVLWRHRDPEGGAYRRVDKARRGQEIGRPRPSWRASCSGWTISAEGGALPRRGARAGGSSGAA